jgi:hypothetical protein
MHTYACCIAITGSRQLSSPPRQSHQPTTRPYICVHSDMNQYEGLEVPTGVKAVKFQAPVNFVVNHYIEDEVEEWVEEAQTVESQGQREWQRH